MEKSGTISFQNTQESLSSGSPQSVRQLRDALSCFATGVVVVTTLGPSGERIGVTINSFSSLSLSPPLILWCLSLDSGLVDHFEKGQRFNIIFLSSGQRGLGEKFSRPGEERFEGLKAPASDDGVPLLFDAAGALECVVEETHSGGDHIILVGGILRFGLTNKAPLLFHRGQFKTF